MSDRVTQVDLEAAVDRLNRLTCNPANAYQKDEEGRIRSVPGVFVTDYGNGGVKLVQIVGDAGGQRNVFDCGYTTKRELLDLINAYCAALRDYSQGFVKKILV